MRTGYAHARRHAHHSADLIHIRTNKHEYILTVLVVCFVSNGLYAPVWRTSTWKITVSLYCPTVSGSSTVGPEHRLFLKLFNNYSSESRPVTNASRPVTVKFAVSFNQLLDLVRLLVLLLLLCSSSASLSFFFFFLLLPRLRLPLVTVSAFSSSYLCIFFPFLDLVLFRLPLFTSSSPFYIFLFLCLDLLFFTPSLSSFLQLLSLFTPPFSLK